MSIHINQKYCIVGTKDVVEAKAMGDGEVCVRHWNGVLELVQRDRLRPQRRSEPVTPGNTPPERSLSVVMTTTPEWRERTTFTSNPQGNTHIDLAEQWLRVHGSVAQSELEAGERVAATAALLINMGPGQAGRAKLDLALAAHSAIRHAAKGPQYAEDVKTYIRQYHDLIAARPSPPIDSGKCNLATKIARLEGLTVTDECKGENYCKILNPNRSPTLCESIKYDPIARPAILGVLIPKYRVDLDWREDGACEVSIYDWDACERTVAFTVNLNGCFATAVLTVILEAEA